MDNQTNLELDTDYFVKTSNKTGQIDIQEDLGVTGGRFEPRPKLQRSPPRVRRCSVLRPGGSISGPTSQSEDGNDEVYYSPLPERKGKPGSRSPPMGSPKGFSEIICELRVFLDQLKNVPASVSAVHSKTAAMETHVIENRNTNTFIKTAVSALRGIVDPLHNKVTRLGIGELVKRVQKLESMYEAETQMKRVLQNRVLDLKLHLEEKDRKLTKVTMAYAEAQKQSRVRVRSSPTPPNEARRRKIPRSKSQTEPAQSDSETTETAMEWTVVESRKRTRARATTYSEITADGANKGARPIKRALPNVKKKSMQRPPAVTIAVNENFSYRDALKTVKSQPGIKEAGITAARETAAGHLLLQFDRATDTETVARVRNELSAMFGDKTTVNSLVKKCIFEVKDIDTLSEKEEVLEEIRAGTGARNLRMLSFRSGFGNMNRAVLICDESEQINRAISSRRILVGFVNCTIRRLPNVTRCYRCHELGHMAGKCPIGADIKEICRRCGAHNHKMADCGAQPRCIICTKRGIPEQRTGHITASISCPTVQSYIP